MLLEKNVKQSQLNLNLTSVISRNRNLLPLFVVTIGVFAFMSIVAPEQFLTFSNFQAMAFNFPEFGLLAIAVMLSMLLGGIDLSVIATANLSGVIAALILTKISTQANPSQIILMILLAFAVQIVAGTLCGMLNGFLITKLRIPDILATLGTMQLFTGLAMVVTKGKIIEGFPEQAALLGNGVVFGIPITIIVFIVLAVVVAILLNRTSFGFELYMMGTNTKAARFTGINNNLIIMKTYALSGLLSSVAGILFLSSNSSVNPNYGSSYLLQAIVVAVLGGVDPAGGFGTLGGLIIAVICQQFLSSGFDILRIGGSASSYAEQMTWGFLLLLVMVINYFSNKKAGKIK